MDKFLPFFWDKELETVSNETGYPNSLTDFTIIILLDNYSIPLTAL
jgi:hypothetical protein